MRFTGNISSVMYALLQSFNVIKFNYHAYQRIRDYEKSLFIKITTEKGTSIVCICDIVSNLNKKYVIY